MRTGKALVAAMATTIGLIFLTGCSTPSPTSDAPDPSTPEFTGPYAEEFRSDYESASSDFVRAVLRDGQVTEQEYSEMQSLFAKCLATSGIVIKLNEDGSFNTTAPKSMTNDTSHAITVRCSKESGEDVIGSLYSFVHRNPEHLDENTIMAACLVRQKVVSPDYSAKDFARDSPAGDFIFVDPTNGRKALETCSSDPLDLLGTQ